MMAKLIKVDPKDVGATYEAYKQAVAEANRLRKQATEEMIALLFQAAKEDFERFPEIEEIYWTQYTPYVGRGKGTSRDFYVHALNVKTDEQPWDYYDPRWDELHCDPEAYDDEVLRQAFGDHVKVQITPDAEGFLVTEHDHE